MLTTLNEGYFTILSPFLMMAWHILLFFTILRIY